MTLVFFGAGAFGLPSLDALLASDHRLAAVVTSPEKPSGRHLAPKPSAVKLWAIQNHIRVIEMASSKESECFAQLKEIKPDLFIVIAFGKILRKNYLELPVLGAINVHGSLLPKYRGASPMQSAVLGGDSETGVSVMRMVEELDAGEVCLTKKISLQDKETIVTLEPKLSALASHALMESLGPIEARKADWIAQDPNRATYCAKIKKEDGRLRWDLSAQQLDRQVRAYLAWPGSYTLCKGKRLVVKVSRPEISTSPCKHGQIQRVSPAGIAVATSDGCLVLEELQLEGRKTLRASEFLKGTPLKAGELLE